MNLHNKNTTILFLPMLGIFILSIIGCKKNIFNTSGNLNFSKDTIVFDTIFTSIGSSTFQFKIYNNNNSPVNISEIKLMGGTGSPFRINIDGDNSNTQQNIEILSKDSLFGFVEVTLNVNNSNWPMVIQDSIEFQINGNKQYIQLIAWGQDVYIHNKEIISSNQTLPNDKPHLVYGYLAVDSLAELTIQPGTKMHFHNNAQLLIYKASLKAQGLHLNKIYFEGDRLESFYDDVKGQWYGIRFVEAKESNIEWAVIKNGSVGIQIDSTYQLGQKININNTEIKNQSFYGIWANAGGEINAFNMLVNACNQHTVFLFAGGDYNFKQCTFGGYKTEGRETPLFRMQNYFQGKGSTIFVRPIKAQFTNCAIYGNQENEFNMDTLFNSFSDFINFNSCLIKSSKTSNSLPFNQVKWNLDPKFVSPTDLHFLEGSSLKNAGTSGTGVFQDLDGNNYNSSNPSIGCYEN